MSAPAGNDTQTAPTADTTRDAFSLPAAVKDVLTPLASLRLTVALFALSIALVFFGTLAQHRKDVWDVVHEYFRCGVAFVEFQDLLPPSFFPSLPQMPGGFYFPGGWLIGGVMAVNLLAAHAVRFKIQASGPRLSAGLAVLGIGSALTYLVVQSGMGETFQADPLLSWQALWNVFRVGGWLGTAATLYWLARELVAEKRDGARIRVAAFSTVPMVVLSAWLLITPTIAPESMRILWQLMKGTFAGLVLLVGCLMVFKKRAGIVLLHAGVGLLMLSELLVGLYAQEGQLRLYEGETRNYIEDIRTAELAIVDDSDPTVDRVVVVPISLLREGGTVSHPQLPFDIEVARLLPNARVRAAGPVEPNPATAGIGSGYIAEPARAATGVDVGSGVDLPAAYLNIVDPDSGVSLGTYLASVVFEPDEANRVTTSAGQTRAVSLRFEREYLPVEVTLNDVRKVDYVGTSTPRDYSSFIRLLDGETGVDRDVRVWMNNPLRYSGRTFYQSSYIEAAPAAGRSEGTVLQVVTNEGWMLPYVSCMVVAVGMVAQFVVTLLRFLGRETRPKPAALLASADSAALTTTPAAATACCDWKGWAVPAVITLAFAGYLAGKFRPPAAVDTSSPSAEAEFDYAAFGRLPVAFGGRVKPLDTLARNAMKQINGNRETYKVVDPATGDKTTHDAIEWLAAVVAEPAEAAKLRVFRIENLEVLQLLGLEKRKGFRYSLSEFVDRIVPAPPTEFQQRLSSAFGTRRSTPSRLTDFERDLLAFVDKLGVPPGLLASGQADERERVRARLIAADPGPIEIASPD
ncbi:MAG: cytochrome c biogenesis protein ResB, partial [Planctomycetota bacterium]